MPLKEENAPEWGEEDDFEDPEAEFDEDDEEE